jgi:putative membrane protein
MPPKRDESRWRALSSRRAVDLLELSLLPSIVRRSALIFGLLCAREERDPQRAGMATREDRRFSYNSSVLRVALIAVTLVVLVWSGIGPKDRFTWFLEVAPVLIGLPLLIATFRRFPLSTLTYVLLAVHGVILMIGGHYTYAEVPVGDWVRAAFGFQRNHYDRVGHFAQGFVPAIVAREILLRNSVVDGKRWLAFIIVSICLAISAMYELLEWLAAVTTGEAADAFLGTQGDVWDTQMDMFLALIGAISALLLLSRLHDRSMSRTLRGRTQV